MKGKECAGELSLCRKLRNERRLDIANAGRASMNHEAMFQ